MRDVRGEGPGWWEALGAAALVTGVIGAAAIYRRRRAVTMNGSLAGGEPGLALEEDMGRVMGFRGGASSGGPRTGSAFAAEVAGMSEDDYQDAVFNAALDGSLPPTFQRFVRVDVASRGQAGTFWISPMALSIGTDDDCFHAPTDSVVAARIAARHGLYFPTSRMIDLVRELPSAARVPFRSQDDHHGVDAFTASSAGIERRRAGRIGNVTDYYKTYVISNMRRGSPARSVIYGAWENASTRIQSRSTRHSLTYFDYSQQAMFVWPRVLVAGVEMDLGEALTRSASAHLFSDEGVIAQAMLRYPI